MLCLPNGRALCLWISDELSMVTQRWRLSCNSVIESSHEMIALFPRGSILRTSKYHRRTIMSKFTFMIQIFSKEMATDRLIDEFCIKEKQTASVNAISSSRQIRGKVPPCLFFEHCSQNRKGQGFSTEPGYRSPLSKHLPYSHEQFQHKEDRAEE